MSVGEILVFLEKVFAISFAEHDPDLQPPTSQYVCPFLIQHDFASM
jgi:hypothetical protein